MLKENRLGKEGHGVCASIDSSYRCHKTIERKWGQPAFFLPQQDSNEPASCMSKGWQPSKMEVGSCLGIYSDARPKCYISKSSQQKGPSQPALMVNGSFSDNEAQDIAGSCFEVRSDSSF